MKNKKSNKRKPHHASKVQVLANVKGNYSEFYKRTLPKRRHLVFAILEIGFNMESLKILEKLFPKALIHTLDFFDHKKDTFKISKKEIENQGFFVYDMETDHKAKSLNTISSQFDIIIDHGTVFPTSRQMVFNLLYNKNTNPNGLYYLEDLKQEELPGSKPEDQCGYLAKAVFNADRKFSNKYLNSEAVTKLIEDTEWCDLDPNEEIACFKKIKPIEKKVKVPASKAKPTDKQETKNDAGQSQGQDQDQDQEQQKEQQKELAMPDKLKFKFFEEKESVVEKRESFGPLKKDIFVSFFGKVPEAPMLFELYSGNSDFFFADLVPESERYRMEMARSIFSLCVNDIRIFDALISGTIPVIPSSQIINSLYSNCMIICSPEKIGLQIDLVYRDSEAMERLKRNGKLLLQKLFR
ncbi:MAG: hypothetical protein PHT07_15310 [Paludibacter sp.]|nr:hypothetical protein [Paludibacter sp.]